MWKQEKRITTYIFMNVILCLAYISQNLFQQLLSDFIIKLCISGVRKSLAVIHFSVHIILIFWSRYAISSIKTYWTAFIFKNRFQVPLSFQEIIFETLKKCGVIKIFGVFIDLFVYPFALLSMVLSEKKIVTGNMQLRF